ncbi:MAG: hypothetical protein ACTJHW_09035 [Paenalcaligenes sp.]
MTLIIAGYKNNRFWGEDQYDEIFIIGDTLISTLNAATGERDRLIDIYKKIRQTTVSVWSPSIRDGYFEGYHSVAANSACAIAFAGSTLTFEHILNGIVDHLTQLRYTFSEESYKIVKHCSHEALKQTCTQVFSDGISFRWHDLPKLTADFQMEVISHVMRKALKDVSKHRLKDQQSFEAIRCELAVALYCHENDKPVLFHAEVVLSEEIPRYASFKYRKIEPNEVLVLGMQIQEAAHSAMQEFRHRQSQNPDEHDNEMCVAETLVRQYIQKDEADNANQIGGRIDCLKFKGRTFSERWYAKPN